MSDDLSQELRAFETSEALANGDFSVCIRAADLIEAQAPRIETLEAALRGLDDMIVDLDAGHRELHEVSRFINGALTGWKR